MVVLGVRRILMGIFFYAGRWLKSSAGLGLDNHNKKVLEVKYPVVFFFAKGDLCFNISTMKKYGEHIKRGSTWESFVNKWLGMDGVK